MPAMPHSPHHRIAVDIGGTFTDTVLVDADNQVIATAKTATTPENPTQGALAGVSLVIGEAGITLAEIGGFIHGTTLATNALIERRGAQVASITTAGFRDILEIAYERRYSQYDINIDKPDLIVPRERCFTIAERMSVRGEVLEPLVEDEVDALVQQLKFCNTEAVAICLLHAYANPAHEQRLRELLLERMPELTVSLSSDVSPGAREFDRLCTTIANAYIQPLMAEYLQEFADTFAGEGLRCPILMMTAGGGMTTLETAARYPIRLVESGPVGGAILAAQVAAQCGEAEVLSFDMGGTTAKLCLIDNFQPQTSGQFEIGRAARFIKGSGMPVRIPVVEMIEIGAGGGSIAGVDALGRLTVGPKSAGSEPGPAAFGKGGEQPTVTDADVMLGLIDPGAFAEGRLQIQRDAAQSALQQHIAQQSGLDAMQAAQGVSQIVDENMASAGRMHAVESGKDLGTRTMIAFGGNGPLHATRVARRAGVQRIVIPADPGVGSAVGFLSAPIAFEVVRSRYATLATLDIAQLNTFFAGMTAEAEAVVQAGAPQGELDYQRIAYMRYHGQGHEIEISLPSQPLTEDDIPVLLAAFETEYAQQFTRTVPGMTVEILNWAVKVSTKPEGVQPLETIATQRQAKCVESRSVLCDVSGEAVEAAVYQRLELRPGDVLHGPALVVEPQTTTFVSVDFVAAVDAAGNLVLESRLPEFLEENLKSQIPSVFPKQRLQNKTFESKGSAFQHIPSLIEGSPTLKKGERGGFKTSDKTHLQVMWNRLLAVVEEQGQALIRAAFSPIVRECGDISAGIFDLDGRMLAQAVTGTPGHINTMAEAVKSLRTRYAISSMNPGDIYVTNDPWLASGHLNDFLLFMPVFRAGEVVGFTSCTSHLVDLGGLGMGPEGSDIQDEGLLIPPCKLVEQGEVNALLLEIVKANSREPIANEGDIYALIACCEKGAQRLVEMMDEFALSDLKPLADYIIDTSRRGTIEAISRIPAGEYKSELLIDGYEKEIKLCAMLTVAADHMVLDFSGTSGCSMKGINVPLNYAAAYSVFALRCIIGPEIPNNAGSLEPFIVTAPDNCILNALHPAPVAMRHTIGQMTPDLVYGCLHQALPEEVPAEGASCMYDLPLRHTAEAARDGGHQFALELVFNGGTGARPGKDGLSATAFPSGVWGSQVETTEAVAPVLIKRRELRVDSGGAGQYRGGLGQYIEVTSAIDEDFLLFLSVERVNNPARGRMGGLPGAAGRIQIEGSDAVLPGKGEVTVKAGETLVFETPGGGGFGDPVERAAEDLLRDDLTGVVSG